MFSKLCGVCFLNHHIGFVKRSFYVSTCSFKVTRLSFLGASFIVTRCPHALFRLDFQFDRSYRGIKRFSVFGAYDGESVSGKFNFILNQHRLMGQARRAGAESRVCARNILCGQNSSDPWNFFGFRSVEFFEAAYGDGRKQYAALQSACGYRVFSVGHRAICFRDSIVSNVRLADDIVIGHLSAP